jgi:hypothetical protein
VDLDFDFFEIHQTHHSKLGMLARPVAEDFDIAKDIGTSLIAG